ncbi:chromate efflux transporter [Planktomarina sp.]|uniref:chromate efflux transporter n=1 Tax=Planktomarina sp. TaxID=2024851 RepID=UPI002890A213|nr:chromate efflux transporter [Planktomarina sp.]
MQNQATSHVSLTQFTAVVGKIGLLSFGGPAAQIALMQDELVDKRGWVLQQDFLRALSFCMLLPGPEAMQLATYLGWRLHGLRGGFIGGTLFILPGACVIFALAWAYVNFGHTGWSQAAFTGIKACVIVIVLQALLKICTRALILPMTWAIAASSFCAVALFDLPYPWVVLATALWGVAALRTSAHPKSHTPVPKQRTLAASSGIAALWALPIAILWSMKQVFLTKIALLFSTLAVVTFGGAYAVLGYLAQTAVTDLNWLTPPQMIDALGLAETTPGPLILVTQFVGFLAGFQAGGISLAFVAGLLTLWVTFLPCFLWIFLFAPHLERLMSIAWLARALAGITAAVVGVIASLSIWFAGQIWFVSHIKRTIGPLHLSLPDLSSFDPLSLCFSALAALLLLWRKWDILWTLPLVALLAVGISTF